MINRSSNLVNEKSKKPRNNDTSIEIIITNIVKTIDCFLVGQLTCLSSLFVSLI